MKVFRYIFTKALYSFLGVFLILCAIDFSFNFFSEMEDINDNYTYQDLIIYLLKTEPYRMREFVYLCFVGVCCLSRIGNWTRALDARQWPTDYFGWPSSSLTLRRASSEGASWL